ncbi:hypothetical protein M9435_002441 [Picochlorum sp. BPE23]|nr:hypothetical protein M9435_002441 [Picochlorum sp. BPE23]
MEDDRPEQPGVVGGDMEDIAVGVGEEPVEQPEEEPEQPEEEPGQPEEAEQQGEEDEQQQQQQQQQQEEDISFPKSLLKRLVKEQMDQEVCKSKEGTVVDVQQMISALRQNGRLLGWKTCFKD